jgi:HSP20 family protein
MTFVRLQNRPNGFASFNNLLSDVFPQTPSFYKEQANKLAAVNIKETDTTYLLDMVAPGLNKEDFSIQVDKNQLTVSAEKKNEAKGENEKDIRKEFELQSFKRSFTLDDKINAEAISAQYVNGILTLNLPKKEEVKPQTKQINIQ